MLKFSTVYKQWFFKSNIFGSYRQFSFLDIGAQRRELASYMFGVQRMMQKRIRQADKGLTSSVVFIKKNPKFRGL